MAAEGLLRPRDPGAHRLRVGDVEGYGEGAAAGLLDLPHGLLGPLGHQVVDGDGGAWAASARAAPAPMFCPAPVTSATCPVSSNMPAPRQIGYIREIAYFMRFQPVGVYCLAVLARP